MTDLLDPAPVAAKDAPVDPAVGRSGVGAFFAYWLFTSLYPTLRLATRSYDANPLVVRLLVASGLVALLVATIARSRLKGLIGTLVLVGATAAPALVVAGRWAGLWAAAAAFIGLWGIFRRAPLRFVPVPTASLAPMLFGVGLGAAFVGRSHDDWRLPGFVAVAGLLVAVGSWFPRRLRALDAIIQRIAEGAGAAVLWLLGGLVLCIPWAVHRALRWDPLQSGRGWIDRRDLLIEPNRSWFVDPGPAPTLRRRAHAGIVALVSIAALVAVALLVDVVAVATSGVAGGPQVAEAPPDPRGAVAWSMHRQSWWTPLSDSLDDMYARSRLSQYVGLELPDVSGEWLHINDGHRRTWSPPAASTDASCRRLRVWMFGGSAMFGIGQRDDHTVASELARVAAADGVDLDIVNWGVQGDVAWQQVRRLERALLADDVVRPDLVVFFDGANDLATVDGAAGLPWVVPGDFVGPLDRIHMRALTDIQRDISDDQSAREIDLRLSLPENVQSTAKRTVAVAVRQYAAANELATRLLDSFGISFVQVMQPLLSRRADALDEEPLIDARGRKEADEFVADLPEGVIDLSDPYRKQDGPLFVDLMHTDERGTALLAPTLYQRLRPTLERLINVKEWAEC